MVDTENNEVDALCPECGYSFKAYVDRLLSEEINRSDKENVSCPVCGCTKCEIGRQIMRMTVELPAVDYFLFFHYNNRKIPNSFGICWEAENEVIDGCNPACGK